MSYQAIDNQRVKILIIVNALLAWNRPHKKPLNTTIMFNRICNYIDIQLLDNVESITNNIPVIKDGFTWDRIISEKSAQWIEKPSRSKSGTIYNQTLIIVSDKFTELLKNRYPVNIPVIAILYDDNGHHIFGNYDEIARIIINPGTDKDSIEITRQALKSIY